MAASALNRFVVACLLALVVVAGAARTEPADPDVEEMSQMRPCHSNNAWSMHLCRDVCQASGFNLYDFALPNAAAGGLARCCCCPTNDQHGCLSVRA